MLHLIDNKSSVTSDASAAVRYPLTSNPRAYAHGRRVTAIDDITAPIDVL